MHETETKLQQDENLRKAANRVREELADADRNDVDARYAVARICSEVKEGYGKQGLTFLESQLGLAPSTLYRYVKVPEVWAPDAFKAATAKPNSKNLPLSWSHWELLATVKDGRTRKALLDRTLRESLNVRDLRRAVEEAAAVTATESDGARGTESYASTRAFTSLLFTLKKQAQDLEKRVLSKAATSKTRPAVDELSELAKTSEHIASTIETLTKLVARIEEITTRAMALQETRRTPDNPPPAAPGAIT